VESVITLTILLDKSNYSFLKLKSIEIVTPNSFYVIIRWNNYETLKIKIKHRGSIKIWIIRIGVSTYRDQDNKQYSVTLTSWQTLTWAGHEHDKAKWKQKVVEPLLIEEITHCI
jgi:hypothetical protein